MKKTALFVMNGDPGSFILVALNAMDMKDRGYDVKVVMEGEATKLVSLLRNETKAGALEWKKLKALALVDCVCEACATKSGVTPAVMEQGLRMSDEMKGHPSIAAYEEQGYEVLIF